MCNILHRYNLMSPAAAHFTKKLNPSGVIDNAPRRGYDTDIEKQEDRTGGMRAGRHDRKTDGITRRFVLRSVWQECV